MPNSLHGRINLYSKLYLGLNGIPTFYRIKKMHHKLFIFILFGDLIILINITANSNEAAINAFEIEKSTSIYSGILRLLDLVTTIRFYSK